MTVTKPQAQMLATLAAACRPNGARRWDTAGAMAAIDRVADRDLAEVIMAVVRAARDRDVDSPGVIPTTGQHWREQLKPLPFTPQVMNSTERCSICSNPRHNVSDHEFESAAMAAKRRAEADPDAVKGAVAALKDEIAHPPERPPAPHGLEDYADRNEKVRAKVDRLRAEVPGLATPAMRESEEAAE